MIRMNQDIEHVSRHLQRMRDRAHEQGQHDIREALRNVQITLHAVQRINFGHDVNHALQEMFNELIR